MDEQQLNELLGESVGSEEGMQELAALFAQGGMDTGWNNNPFFAQMMGEGFFGWFAGGFIVGLILIIVCLVALCVLFQKMGHKWYEALISGHNTYVWLTKAGKPGWWVFAPLVLIVPLLGPFILLILAVIIWIVTNIGLAKKFGKDGGFAAGMIFLPFIFYPILARSKAVYHDTDVPQINQPVQTTPFPEQHMPEDSTSLPK